MPQTEADISENINTESISKNGKGELYAAMESQIETPSVRAQLKTTVSKLAIALPSFFMSDADAAKMVSMLQETRDEIYDVAKFDEGKALLEQEFNPANDNSAPSNIQNVVSLEKAA